MAGKSVPFILGALLTIIPPWGVARAAPHKATLPLGNQIVQTCALAELLPSPRTLVELQIKAMNGFALCQGVEALRGDLVLVNRPENVPYPTEVELCAIAANRSVDPGSVASYDVYTTDLTGRWGHPLCQWLARTLTSGGQRVVAHWARWT